MSGSGTSNHAEGPGNADATAGPGDVAVYCREIETYLCRKNDGHLIRVVGPAFERVSQWAADGVPLKVACRGIDRYFERYYRQGKRRRPVRIEFCEDDVLDVYDEWRRALGLAHQRHAASADNTVPERSTRNGPTLPEHLERVLLRLTNARASGVLGAEADGILDAVAGELDRARSTAQGLRGNARQALLDRLAVLDGELLRLAEQQLPPEELRRLTGEAEADLIQYRTSMTPDVFRRTVQAAFTALLRDRYGLPTLTLS